MAGPKMAGPRGFTLVELLTVIVILGVLMGLITTAAIRARLTAKNGAVVMEIAQIADALEAYAQQYGEYPPDFTDQNRVLSHLRVRFPNWTGGTWDDFGTAVQTGCGLDVNDITPASALVFWLAGLPPTTTSGEKPRGFHANPANPFQGGNPRTPPSYEFNKDRLRQGKGGWWEYFPSYIEEAPLVYFRARSGAAAGSEYNGLQYNRGGVAGIAVPYQAGDGTWRNPQKFQIISCGFDGIYGTNTGPRRSQTGQGCTPEDYDNHTNFSKGTIGDEIQ